MVRVYEIELAFKVPNDQGRLLDLRSKVFDIIYAVEEFNYTDFKDSKKIYLANIDKRTISLLLYIDKLTGTKAVTARDISVFSKRLYHDKNWSIFTKENAKLFTTIKFEERFSYYYEEKFKEDRFYSQEVLELTKLYPDDNLNIPIFNSHILSDKDLLIWIEKLIATQELGSEFQIEKTKKAIYQLKEIIKSYLS